MAKKTISGTNKRYTGTAAADVLTVTGTGNTVDGAKGNDTITVSGGSKHIVSGSTGADTITIGKKAGSGISVYGDDKANKISGNDKIIIEGGSKNYIYGGKGNDTVTVNGGSANYIYGGAGNDTYVIGKSRTGTAIVKDFANKEILKVEGGQVSSIALSGKNLKFTSGKGSITLENAKGKTVTVQDSLGSYTVTTNASTGVGTITLDAKYKKGSLNTGSFLTNVASTTIDASKTTAAINITGNGKANIIKTGKGSGDTYKGGAGNDTITAAGGSHTIDGGTGDDTITVTGGNNHTLRGGTGSDTYAVNMALANGTKLTVNQSDYNAKEVDVLKLSKVSKNDVIYGSLNGILTIKQKKTGGFVTVSGWDRHALNKIVFSDGTVTAAQINKQLASKKDVTWNAGDTVTLDANTITSVLQINGHRVKDFIVNLYSDKKQLVLRDADNKSNGTLTINNWNNNTVNQFIFKSENSTETLTGAQFSQKIFTVTALGNGTVYSGGAGQRQQFNLELNASTDVTISSVSGSEDRIKLTDHHSTDNFSFRIEGNDFCIYDYDPETNSQTGGKIVLKNYKENTVKAIEFDDTTYHFVTGNDTISNVSDTHSDRYVFLDNDWRNRETAGESWEVTVEDFTPSGALDFRFLPNNGRYYSIASEADGRDMVLTYKYSPTPTTDATLGTIRLKNFFNADGTVNETTGFTKIRTVREVYSGNRSANAWDSWVWDGSNQGYRFLRLNAGTSGDDTVDLGAARPAGGASAWMYFAGAGDDTITAKEGDIVYGEAGADKILVSGHYGEAHGGIGDDTITIQSVNGNNRHHAVVRGDAGEDVINAYGSYHYINGGSGDDEIHIYSGENSDVMSHHNGISGSWGNDKIYIHSGDYHVANGGADNDEIYIYGGKNTRANGGDGTDTITVSGGTGHVVNGGTEDDVITVTGGTGHMLNGGVGSDSYVMDMDFTADTNLIVDQVNSDGEDADILQLARVNKNDVAFAMENGALIITHSSGGTITVEGWGNHPLTQIQFADNQSTDNQSMTADEINQQLGRNGIDWTLGNTVILDAANLDSALQINGYKSNDFVVTLNPDENRLVLADAQDGTITINHWNNNAVNQFIFKSENSTETLTGAQFSQKIFTVTALENGTVYRGGTVRRQQFNLELNASTDVTISSIFGSEDRIKLTDHHSTENFNFRIEGDDFYIYDYDPEANSQTGGKIVLTNYKENTVKAIEFDDTTYHFVTGSETISNVSDTYSERYVFLDNDWRNSETAVEPWEVTVEDFTPSGALDFRFLPNNGRYYSIASQKDGQDMVLTYNYSPTSTTGATLGTIRLKNFFNADGTVNETTGFTKIRTIREVYSGNRSANAWDSWVWNSNREYRFLRLNAGTSGDDTVNLGAERPAGGASAWMYFAGAGDDTITAKEGDIVYGEAGADKINVTGHYGEAHGGSGDDIITIQSPDGHNRHHAVVRGDAGNDIINAYGSFHYINGGSGEDEIHIYSDESSEVESHYNGISGSRGNDKIYIHAGNNHVANGGADNDEIYISGGNNTRANGGDGTDQIAVSGGTGHVVNGGTEGDVITVTGGTGHVLNGGVGSDRYVVDMDFTADTKLTVDQMNSDGADVDILQLSKVNKGDVAFAVENGALTITHSSGGTITVEGWGNHPLAQIQFADNQSIAADEINEALAEPAVVTVTQQSVIKNFMKSLDENTTLITARNAATAALDTAVNYASSGKFATWDALTESFISDVREYGVKDDSSASDFTYSGVDEYGHALNIIPESGLDRFLRNYCGIDLTNDDTGSIIGADAGGAEVKTAVSIVPENGTVAMLGSPEPGTSTTINGLTIHWPAAEEINNDAKKQYIVDSLYTWWAEEGLNLVDEAFGVNFMEDGVTGKDMTVEFVEVDENFLAKVETNYSYQYTMSGEEKVFTSETTTLNMKINMKYFNSVDTTGVDGYAPESNSYLDRTIAHEFTHAVMGATMERVYAGGWLPKYVTEGLAELVHGIDDFRTTDIIGLARSTNTEHLTQVLQPNVDAGSDSYAAGYMLFRYLAWQTANTVHGQEVNESSNVIATPATEGVVGELVSSSSMLTGNAMTVSDLGENSLAIASIQNSLIDFADSRISDSLAGVQQEDKQNSSLFITGNV